MFVSEILSEAEYKIVPFGTGRSKKFNIVSVDSGQVVGSARNRFMAQNQIKSLTKQPSPADQLKAKSSNTVDRTKGVKAADDYLDKKGVKDKTVKSNTPKPDAFEPPKGGLISKTKEGIKNFAKKVGGGAAGGILFFAVSVDDFLADVETFAKAYEKTGCNIRDKRMNAAQIRFADRLTSNVSATFLGIATGALSIKYAKKILNVLRLGALFAGPMGWIGYLLTWVGAEAAMYAIIKMFEAKWFHAAISDYLMNTTFTKRNLRDWSIGLGYITKDSPCYSQAPGFIRNEAVELDEGQMIFETVTKAEIKSGIKDLIVNDPKMLALMKKAKRNKARDIKAKVT